MEQITLGKSGLVTPALGFGGIPIQRLTEDGAIDVVRHCIDSGLTFIDTANGYTTSEERIGKAIAGRRDGLILATKSHGRDADTFRREMELSFQRLQVDYIDLYQFHGVSKPADLAAVIAPGGPLSVALEAKEAGRIGHIGVTSHSLDLAIELAASDHFETLMFPFNFITREPADQLLQVCAEHNVGFIAMKPVGGGLLDDIPVAFKWLRQFPNVLSLVGIQSAAEIDEILAVMNGPAGLDADEIKRLEALRVELGTRFCRSCDYCQPCPQEIPISSVLRLQSHARRMPPERVFGEWGKRMVSAAEGCADCGDCESRCPYELPIREMLQENVAWFHAQSVAG